MIYFSYGYNHSVETGAVKKITVKGHYTIVNNTEDVNTADYVMKASLTMPQPPRNEKENYSK